MMRISEAGKLAIIKKALSKNGQTVAEIARENNIGRSTLNKWVKRFKDDEKNSMTVRVKQKIDGGSFEATPTERFKHLQATFGQESAMVGAYCRQHGLY